eukprot:843719-Pyramimonas_sp.AAC.1
MRRGGLAAAVAGAAAAAAAAAAASWLPCLRLVAAGRRGTRTACDVGGLHATTPSSTRTPRSPQ